MGNSDKRRQNKLATQREIADLLDIIKEIKNKVVFENLCRPTT